MPDGHTARRDRHARTASATEESPTGHLGFDAIGTRWAIDTPQPLPLSVEARILAVIDDFDREWSRFRDDSLVTALGREGGTVPVGPDGEAMLRLYSRLHAATDGAVNPMIGDRLAHLGYDASYRLTPAPEEPRPIPGWEGRFHTPSALLTLARGSVLDVGAIGKGRLVDVVATILERAGISGFTVDAGGDIRHLGPPSLQVALEHPFNVTRAVGRLELRDASIAASATNRRAWAGGLHHILDARTGAPVDDVAATWAVARTAMLADAASMAAFFLPPAQVLSSLDGVHAVVVMAPTGPLVAAGLVDGLGGGPAGPINGELFA